MQTPILRLREEFKTIEPALRQRVQATETPLLQVCGVGTRVAARLIGARACAPRIPSAAVLAALAGIAPITVSSGGGDTGAAIAGATGNGTRPSPSSPGVHCVASRLRKGMTRKSGPRGKRRGPPCAA